MIQVRIAGKGNVNGTEVAPDPTATAHCDLCDTDVDAVASVGTAFGCKSCLRERLEAMTVGAYQLTASAGLPWGKVTS